jgi:hypothetical protein
MGGVGLGYELLIFSEFGRVYEIWTLVHACLIRHR